MMAPISKHLARSRSCVDSRCFKPAACGLRIYDAGTILGPFLGLRSAEVLD